VLGEGDDGVEHDEYCELHRLTSLVTWPHGLPVELQSSADAISSGS